MTTLANSEVRHGALSISAENNNTERSTCGCSLTLAFCSVIPFNDINWIQEASNVQLPRARVAVGQGATCTVHKSVALIPNSDGVDESRIVAIKQKSKDISLDAWLLAAWRDIRIMSHKSLVDSNVVHALGYFWEAVGDGDGQTLFSPCLVMPLAMDGQTLQDLFNKDLFTLLPEESASCYKLMFAKDLANGLLALHQSKVVHGDLKPQNILVFQSSTSAFPSLKISDFSHSIIMSDYEAVSSTEMPQYSGTRPFLIPEVHRRDKESMDSATNAQPAAQMAALNYYACDIFGLGMLIATIANNGKGLYTRIGSVVSSAGQVTGSLKEDECDTESFIDVLFQTPSGVLDEAKSSLEAVITNPNYRAIIHDCLISCLQDDPRLRASADTVAQELNSRVQIGASGSTPQLQSSQER